MTGIEIKNHTEIRQEIVNKTKEAFLQWGIIQESTNEMGIHVFNLGKAFKCLKDKNLYPYVFGSCDSWPEFCAQTKWTYRTIMNFIELHEAYIEKLGYGEAELAPIPYSRLLLAMPIMQRKEKPEADDIVAAAREQSYSDYRNTIRELKGQSPLVFKIEKSPEILFQVKDYYSFVKSHACIILDCQQEGVDYAHWPRTVGAGSEGFGIPLCRQHHREQEDSDPIEWFRTNKRAIDVYLSSLVK